jgi:protein-S-isoprenylcysteine O-methyltransferase Ste14
LADMTLLWVSWFKMCELDPVKLPIPGFVELIGFVISFIGLLVFFIVLFKLKTVENYNGDLVTSGVFKYFRHPMYLAFIFWLFGFAIFKSAGISLLLAIPFTANILFWRRMEEKDLTAKYSDYEEYKKKTYF